MGVGLTTVGELGGAAGSEPGWLPGPALCGDSGPTFGRGWIPGWEAGGHGTAAGPPEGPKMAVPVALTPQ